MLSLRKTLTIIFIGIAFFFVGFVARRGFEAEDNSKREERPDPAQKVLTSSEGSEEKSFEERVEIAKIALQDSDRRGERWQRRSAIREALEPLAKTDVREAARWVREKLDGMPVGQERTDFIHGAASALTKAEGGSPLAVEFWEQLAPSVDRARLGIDIAEEWGKENQGAARRWAEGFPASPMRDSFLAEVVSSSDSPGNETAIFDLLDAADWKFAIDGEATSERYYKQGAELSRGAGRGVGLRSAFEHLIDEGERELVFARIADIPDQDERNYILREAVGEWVEKDPVWLFERYQSLPGVWAYSIVLDSIATTAAKRDPTRAAQIANGFSDPELRERVLKFVAEEAAIAP